MNKNEIFGLVIVSLLSLVFISGFVAWSITWNWNWYFYAMFYGFVPFLMLGFIISED